MAEDLHMTEQPAPPSPEQPQQTATPPVQQGELRFTQERLDELMGERARLASESTLKKLLADIGYESVDALKKDTVEARKKREAEMSAVERAQTEKAQAEKERDEAKATLESERKQRILDRRDSAIESAAQKARAEAPRDVLLWAKEYARDLLDKALNEDGTVNDKEITALIEKCRTERKNWFTGNAPGSPSNSDGRPPQPDPNKALQGMPIPRL
jgi:hypothetical protein